MEWRKIWWYYVNLDSRPDRRAHAEAQFAEQGIHARRFEAHVPSDWLGQPHKIERMKNRTPGAIGCYMSQCGVIAQGVGTDRVIAVCEDDVCFAPDLKDRLQYIEDHLTWDWDIIYLGATFHVPGKWCDDPQCHSWGVKYGGLDAIPTDDKHIMRVFVMWGTYAYLVNGRNAHKVLDLLDENCSQSDGIDHNFMILGDKLNAFCFVPGMAWQYDNRSNIGNGDTIFSGFKKLGPYVWTDRMSDFDPAQFDWGAKP